MGHRNPLVSIEEIFAGLTGIEDNQKISVARCYQQYLNVIGSERLKEKMKDETFQGKLDMALDFHSDEDNPINQLAQAQRLMNG